MIARAIILVVHVVTSPLLFHWYASGFAQKRRATVALLTVAGYFDEVKETTQ